MVVEPRMGRITQGSIFCGGYAEDYATLPVWGLVITARCDTAHDKTPIVNYLPVVTVGDWLAAHGGLLSVDREESELGSRFKSLLTKRELSTSLLDVHLPTEIASQHFRKPPDLTSQKAIKEAKDAEDAQRMALGLERFRACLSTPLPNREAIQSAVASCKKSVELVIKDLISHKLPGYYFLPHLGSLTEKASTMGYVVLLREVHHVPRKTVAQLIDGVALDAEKGTAAPGLCFDCFDFVYPIAELSSPWTEHLMQSFCHLFGRIGVADIDKKVLAQIVGQMTFHQ